MRKIIVAAVLVVLAVAMFGCGGTAQQVSGSSASSSSSYNYNPGSYK